MAVSARLKGEEESMLDILSRRLGLSRSRVIRESITAYYKRHIHPKSAFEHGEDLFGAAGSGSGSLSSSVKRRLRGKLREKHRAR